MERDRREAWSGSLLVKLIVILALIAVEAIAATDDFGVKTVTELLTENK